MSSYGQNSLPEGAGDSTIEGVSNHPLHEEGMRPRIGTGNSAHTTTVSPIMINNLLNASLEMGTVHHTHGPGRKPTKSNVGSGNGTNSHHVLHVNNSVYESTRSHNEVGRSAVDDESSGMDTSKHGLLERTHTLGDGNVHNIEGKDYTDGDEESDGSNEDGDVYEFSSDSDSGSDDAIKVAGNNVEEHSSAGATSDSGHLRASERGERRRKRMPNSDEGMRAGDSGDKSTAPPPNPAVRYLAWLCMLLAILSGAAIGPAFKFMEAYHIEPILAASWRCQCMSFVLLPLALIESYWLNSKIAWFSPPQPAAASSPHAHQEHGNNGPPVRYNLIVYMVFAGLGWGVNLLCWVTSLLWTSTVRASIFTGLHPLFLVMYMACRGTPVSRLEWLGVVVAIVGITMTIFDETPEQLAETEKAREMEWFGLFLCICSSLAEVLVLVTRSVVNSNVPTMMYTFFTTVEVALFSALMSVAAGADLGFGDNGLFGWMTQRWAFKMFIFGFIVGVVCVAGFVRILFPLLFIVLLGAKFNLCAGGREILMIIDIPCVLFFNALFLFLHFPFCRFVPVNEIHRLWTYS